MSSASIFRSTTAIPHDEPRLLAKPTPEDLNPSPNSRIHQHASPLVRHGQLLVAPPASAHPSLSSSIPPLVSFHSATIAPSPPAQSMPFNTASRYERHPVGPSTAHNGPSTSLRILTDVASPFATSPSFSYRESPTDNATLSPARANVSLNRKTSTSSLRLLTRTPSLKAALTHSLGSVSGTSSVVPSPIITAMGDVTPLPSPLLSADSPGPWKKLAIDSVSPPLPPQRRARLSSEGDEFVLPTSAGESINAAAMAALNRKVYTSLNENSEAAGPALSRPATQQPQPHSRNRSLSEYAPDPTSVSKRPVTVSASHLRMDAQQPHMRREQNFAESRGLSPSVTQPPTPPPSESSRDPSDGAMLPRYEYFEACDRNDHKRRRWRSICTIGQGTFSRVVLATSQMNVPDDVISKTQPYAVSTVADPRLDRKTLVAVKICEHGPRGGASEERVEMSLKRELEIMQDIRHPSLVNLEAWSIEPTRAILVLTYCPGGDLFDIATVHRNLLTPSLTRRIFAELVGAVNYLHERMIVHRDIKFENVLVNLTADELADPSVDWATYPHSVVALGDLGLSRRIAEDEKLETRCGSEDYAAPELIMGQPYDGRATDAWSLGVLLYALLEARLPFDPHPGMNDSHRMRSRKSHRIARVEWRWVEYEGEDGDHEGSEAKFAMQGLLGAMRITEGLLKRARSRWTMNQVMTEPWVKGGIEVDGGLQFREEAKGAEV